MSGIIRRFKFVVVAAIIGSIASVGITTVASATPAAAVNYIQPTLTDQTSAGKFAVGDTISTSTGSWYGDTATFTYQWYTCTVQPSGDPNASNSCSAISGATGSTYIV